MTAPLQSMSAMYRLSSGLRLAHGLPHLTGNQRNTQHTARARHMGRFHAVARAAWDNSNLVCPEFDQLDRHFHLAVGVYGHVEGFLTELIAQ